MEFNKYIYVLIVFGLLINISSVSAVVSGGLGVGIVPKLSTISTGSQQTYTIKIVNTENIDEIVKINIIDTGILPSYQLDLSLFDWLEKTVNIPAKGTVQLQNELTLPTEITPGKRDFKVLVTSSRNISAFDTGIINITLQAYDIAPPASIADLHNVSFAINYINWIWTDPADADFANVSVWIDGVFKENIACGAQFFNATGFNPDTEHSIATRTVDTNGNINQTWVNHTARTAPEITSCTLDGWQYYRDITINNPGIAQTDYQVLVNLTGSAFPTSAQPSGADLRFRDAGGAELSYWFEKWDHANRSALVWVNVTSILASGDTSMRMYYGNPGAGGVSDARATFDLFEDFSGSVLDASWQEVQTVPGVGRYSLTDNAGYLRYYLEGGMSYSGGWANNYSTGSWRPGLTLIRPFYGDHWILETKVNFNLHQQIGGSSTGAQGIWVGMLFLVMIKTIMLESYAM